MTRSSPDTTELSNRIASHVQTLAHTKMHLSLVEWDLISRDLLEAVAALRAPAQTVELLPCPFCDGEPQQKHGYWIECKKCGAGVSDVPRHDPELCWTWTGFRNRDG